MYSESLLGKRITTVSILVNRSSNSIIQAFKEAGYKTSSSTKITEEHLVVLQDYLAKSSRHTEKTAGLTEHARVGIAKMCLKLGLKGKTIEQAAVALKAREDKLLAILHVKAPDLNLQSTLTDKEVLIIRKHLEKNAGAKRLVEKAKIKALREEQLKANPPSKKRRKKKTKQEEIPKLKIIYTPHPKY